MNKPLLRVANVPVKQVDTRRISSLSRGLVPFMVLASCKRMVFLFSACVFDRICVVSIFGSRAFRQECFSFDSWMSVYGLLHGSCYTVPLNLTSVRCRSVCRSRGGPQLRAHHTDGIGIWRLVKRISALLSTHRIGDTVDNVPLLLFPNTFVPTSSDTIS